MSQTQAPTWTTGDRLRKARISAGIESRDMADRLGVSRNTITNWEGDKTTPSLASLRVFAEETGIDLAWLLGLEDDARNTCFSHPNELDQLELFANSQTLVGI
jgi:transcriptional regulator with XRE-family HTH domain